LLNAVTIFTVSATVAIVVLHVKALFADLLILVRWKSVCTEASPASALTVGRSANRGAPTTVVCVPGSAILNLVTAPATFAVALGAV